MKNNKTPGINNITGELLKADIDNGENSFEFYKKPA